MNIFFLSFFFVLFSYTQLHKHTQSLTHTEWVDRDHTWGKLVGFEHTQTYSTSILPVISNVSQFSLASICRQVQKSEVWERLIWSRGKKTIWPFHLTPSPDRNERKVPPHTHTPCQSWLGKCCNRDDAWHGTDDTNARMQCRTSIQTQAKGIFKIYSWNVQSYFREGSHNITSTWW